ncbi:hypothetical protein JAAARDRAFT_134355, partial [Jaapia argillacea MUCL 33604]
QNVIERIFGVMKWQWRILVLPPEYGMDIQTRIPAALCAIHNFIRRFDPDYIDANKFQGDLLDEDNDVAWGDLAEGPANAAERARANTRRDRIALEMWEDYKRLLAEWGETVPMDVD